MGVDHLDQFPRCHSLVTVAPGDDAVVVPAKEFAGVACDKMSAVILGQTHIRQNRHAESRRRVSLDGLPPARFQSDLIG